MSQTWQVTQPNTLAHELCDNVDGLLRHDSVELHQLVMAESLHDLSLLQEGLGGHGSWLQSLHRYLGGAVPHAWHTGQVNTHSMRTHTYIYCTSIHTYFSGIQTKEWPQIYYILHILGHNTHTDIYCKYKKTQKNKALCMYYAGRGL